MNKMHVVLCVIVFLILAARGIFIRGEVHELLRLNRSIAAENSQMRRQIESKKLLSARSPHPLAMAFSQVINKVRFLEGYSGTDMDLSIDTSAQNGDISDEYMPSEYHGVKKLPVLIQFDQLSSQTDMACILSDVYQLEVETDFKVNEINRDHGVLIVKGAVYGL